MPQLETILFRSTPTNSGMTGVVDHQSATLHGVALIQAELEAEGHSLWVDHALLHQLSELGRQNGQVQCNIDHGSGSSDTIGFIDGFRIDGNVLRGDLHLLKSHAQTVTLMEKAERMPKCVGLSAAFKGDPKGVTVGGKQCARAEKLLSFDLVTRPAAAPNGLFSAKDAPTSADLKRQIIALASTPALDMQIFSVAAQPLLFNMPPTNQNGQAEPTMQDILAAVQGLTGRLDAAEQMNQQIVAHLNEQGQQEPQGDQDLFDQLSQLNGMSDEELAANGITRAEVDVAVGKYNANLGSEQAQSEGQLQPEGYMGDPQGQQTTGTGEMAGASAAAGAGSAQFQALHRELIQLKAKFNAKEQAEINFAEAQEAGKVEAKFIALAAQNKELREFSEKAVAQIEALQLHVRTGTRPVKAGVDSGIRLFGANATGELHPFQVRLKAIEAEKKCTPGQAILFAMKEPNGPALHADWVQNQTIHA